LPARSSTSSANRCRMSWSRARAPCHGRADIVRFAPRRRAVTGEQTIVAGTESLVCSRARTWSRQSRVMFSRRPRHMCRCFTPDFRDRSGTQTKLEIDAAAAGIDLALQTQPTRRVTGTLVDAAGDPFGIRDGVFDRAGMSTTVRVALAARSEPGGIQTEPVRTASNSDGTFAFSNLRPGITSSRRQSTVRPYLPPTCPLHNSLPRPR
jgi:hypothetical protein